VPDKRDAAADPAIAAEARGLYAAIAALPDEFRDALVAIEGTSRHTVCHNTFVHPDGRQAVRCTRRDRELHAAVGDRLRRQLLRHVTQKLGPARMDERLYPYGDPVRSGAVVTYGADIPGVQIREIPR
jgi:hypothetical protein